MKKFVPYVNMETVKDSTGKIERFEIRTVTYLPKDSKITTSGEGAVADNVFYRPLSISYDGTSPEFDYFGADFTILRKDIGLLERGVSVKVKSASALEVRSARSMANMALSDPEGEERGTTVEYEDENLP